MFIRVVACLLVFFTIVKGYAQTGGQCPQNIGFETGTFDKWKCYSGSISETIRGSTVTPTISLNETSASYDQHSLIPRSDQKDEYGDFSLNSPNGSKYVVN